MPRRKFDNPTDCPVTRTVQFIGGRWKPIIVYILSDGPQRFGRLVAYIPMVSRKILTEQLRELEADGLVRRTEYREVPPRVEYELTDSGKLLLPVMRAMCEWGQSTGIELTEVKRKKAALLNLAAVVEN